MEFKFEYQPAKFVEMLTNIRTAFPVLEEYAEYAVQEKIDALSERIEAVNADDFQEFARTLKGKELELIIKIMKEPADSKTGKLEDIIKLRFRKKLFDLCWIMLQDDYCNEGLLNAAQVLTEFMALDYPGEYEASFLSKTEKIEGSLPEKGNKLLMEEKSDLVSFYQRYSILENSIFSQKLRELFFTGCEAGGFAINREPLLKHLSGDDPGSTAKVFSAYLEKLGATEYLDAVNNMILEKWGFPENGGEFWTGLQGEKAAKFNAWRDLKKIEQHFGRDTKRYRLWAGYFDLIRRIEADEAAGLLIMEFDNFVILDGKEDSWSYLYTKVYFSHEYACYEGAKQQGTAKWKIISDHVADARDLVIEGVRSDIYRIGYDRVHILYLKEILNETKKGRSIFGK